MQSSDVYSRTKQRVSFVRARVIQANQRQRLQAEYTKNVLYFLLEYCINQPQLLQQPGSFICCPCVGLVKCTQKKREDLKQNEARIKQYIDNGLGSWLHYWA